MYSSISARREYLIMHCSLSTACSAANLQEAENPLYLAYLPEAAAPRVNLAFYRLRGGRTDATEGLKRLFHPYHLIYPLGQARADLFIRFRG